MKIYVHVFTWNEERMLPWFLNYYGKWADKIILWDNDSTDRTCEIARQYENTTIHSYDTDGKFRDDILVYMKNEAWKMYRGEADWHIVVDSDEYLVSTNPIPIKDQIIEWRKNGIDVIKPEGFQMFSETFPIFENTKDIFDVINQGAPSEWYSKMVGFSNDTIESINYHPGCHVAQPMTFNDKDECCGQEVVIYKNKDLKLLHFNYVHELRDLKDRAELYAKRMSKENILNGWSNQYLYWDAIVNEREEIRKNSTGVI